MKTGKLVKYVIEPGQLILTLQFPDGEEGEMLLTERVAILLGDDIFHGLYTGEDDEGHRIRRITRIFDPSSGDFLEDDGMEYEPETQSTQVVVTVQGEHFVL